MLTPEEARSLYKLIKLLEKDENRTFPEFTIEKVLWLATRLREAHDQNVVDLDKIIEMEETIRVLRDEVDRLEGRG